MSAHVFTFARLVSAWVAAGLSLHGHNDGGDTCGSMYVAIFSRRDAQLRRDQIRTMWRDAGSGFGDVAAQFVLCQPPVGEAPEVLEAVKAEVALHNDTLVMDCEDGYLHGALTRKVEAAMRVFLQDHGDRKYFMKTDDDTFASLRRVCQLLKWRERHGKDNTKLYMGVFAEGPENMETKHKPCRDPGSPWYEPFENFAGERFPKSAKGGPGYILSADIVTRIISDGIASSNVLNNEDKAVGVWVDTLLQRGRSVDFLNVKGTDGYDEHRKWTVTSGMYRDYPHILHHHLNGAMIKCLHEIERQEDHETRIDNCFNQGV